MSPKNPIIKAGLAALGLLWNSATTAEGQDALAPPNLPAPSIEQAPSNAPAFAVLLLSNGRVQQGKVSVDKSGQFYLLHQKGGEIRFPLKDVERRFDSMGDLYQYKVASLPARDPDERMKLAQWCLLYQLNAEAREQLQALLEIDPGSQTAQRMMASLDATIDRPSGRDPAVKAASVDVEMAPTARPRTRPTGPIVIFDLPPATANRRATEFAWYIHPILQQSCASCHNENYRGEFQLFAGKSRRDWTPDVIRSNLDATLRYVDRNNPTQSDILAYAVNPHGTNDGRPIFHGANDKRQRDLILWLSSLKPPTDSKSGAMAKSTPGPTAATRPPSGSSDAFGADRFPTAPGAAGVPPSPGLPPLPGGSPGLRAFTESYNYEGSAPGVPPGIAFEAPSPLIGGPMPSLPRQRPSTPSPASGPPKAPTQPPVAPPGPGAATLPNLPPGTTLPPPDDVIPPTNRPKKSKKVDPALLENLMKNRQSPQP
jgi:hypothetical protein